MSTLIFDLETDGLLDEVTKIHCISILDLEKGKYHIFDQDHLSVDAGVQILKRADRLIGHNIIGYDIPVLKKLCGIDYQGKVYDTLVSARLAWADRKNLDFPIWRKGILPGQLMGSHSLESYGYRLGILKGNFGKTTDWKVWTPEMSEYCAQDVTVTEKLFSTLDLQRLSKESLEVEHTVAAIVQRQIQHGWYFDIRKAEALYGKLLQRRTALEMELAKAFHPFYKKGKGFTPKRDNKRYGYIAGATLTKVTLVDFNPASGQHVAHVLKKKYGWEPTEFTEKTDEPKIDEDVLKGLEYPEAKSLGDFLMLQKRIGQIAEGKKSWFNSYNHETHCIHGSVNTCGTNTHRMTHFNPNVAQTPAKHVEYGPECRECYTVRPEKVLVGCDAAGLELRCLAHYMSPYDDGDYGKAVVDGVKSNGTDAHSINARALGMTRDKGKTWFYGFLYGAGDTLLGKGDIIYGKELRSNFLSNLPALNDLIKDVKKASKRGYLKGMDGRRFKIRSKHSALNVLLQGAGAVLMKYALALLDLELQIHYQGRYEFVGNIHDEWQIESDPEIAESIGRLASDSIRLAGEKLNFKIAMDGDWSVGKSWKETH